MKSWYAIKNKTAESATLSIHDEIGLWGVSASSFIADLRALNVKTIYLSIQSPGGNVLEGLAIYNALLQHPATIIATVEGIAASAASFILMAADTIQMPEDSFLMIHNAVGGVVGNADEIRHYADIVEKLQETVVNIYQKRTGLDAADIADMMAAETWMNASEAIKNGFADQIIGKIGAAAKCEAFANHFKTMPFNAKNDLDSIKTERDLESYLRESGLSRSQATAMVAASKKIYQGEPDKKENPQQKALQALSARLENFNFPTLTQG